MNLEKASFWGYKRENGRVGVRNHVIILPVDDLSNAAAQAVENNIKGTMALPHPYGRLQFGADLDLHFRTLIGAGSNPNVAAVVVIGIEDGWAKRVADGIAKTGKPVSYFGIEGHGDMETVRLASKAAKEYVHWASELQRGERPLKDLWVSTKCGESDTTSGIGSNPCVGNAFDKLYPHGVTLVFGETTELTGGEQLVAARCRTPQVRSQFMAMFNHYQDVVNRHKTGDLMDSQPTKCNIIGNPILPVIKICANPRTVRVMAEHIDVDVSGITRREINMDQAGDKLREMMFRTANGRLTAAEALGHREFVLTRLYESA